MVDRVMSGDRLFADGYHPFASEPSPGGVRVRRPRGGPTLFRALRPVVSDAEHGLLQLAARVHDAEPFVIVGRPHASIPPGGDLVDALNSRNEHAYALRAEQRAADAALKRISKDESAGEEEVRAAVEVHTQATARIKPALGALPRVNALRCAPVARALMLYQAEDESAAEASAPD